MPNHVRLFLDLGHTRLKWVLEQGATELRSAQAVRWQDAQALAVVERHWKAGPVPDVVWAAAVCDASQRYVIEKLVNDLWVLPIRWATSRASIAGLHSGYRIPTQLGIDRLLGLLAAWQRYHDTPFCVADLGTAVTIDIVSAAGVHMGGAIAPGLHDSLSAVHHATGLHVAGAYPLNECFGRDTSECIQIGVLASLAGLIEQLYIKAVTEIGGTVRLILTGGDADLIQPSLNISSVVVPNLVLKGLRYYADAVVGESAFDPFGARKA